MSDRDELEALRRFAELERRTLVNQIPATDPTPEYVARQKADKERAEVDPSKGGLPFRPFGFDTGLMMPEGISRQQAAYGKWLADTSQGVQQRRGKVTPQEVMETRQRDAWLLKTPEGKIGYIGGAIINTLPFSMLPGANTSAGALLTGGTLGATIPTGPGESVARNIVASGGNTLVGHLGGRAVTGPVSNVNPQSKRDLVTAALEKYKIDLPASARTGDQRLAYIESQIASLPGGGAVSEAQRRANQQWSRAVMREVGVDEVPTEHAFGVARRNVGSTYDDIWSRNNVNLDNQFLTDAGKALTKGHRMLIPEKARVVDRQADNILSKADAAGNVTGDAYQKYLRPELRSVITSDSSLKNPLRDLQKALDDAANRNISSADSALLSQTNRRYALIKALEDVIPAAEARGGMFMPTQVLSKTGEFGGNIGELGKIGSGLMREPPNSGTAQRLIASMLLMGGGPAALGYATGDKDTSVRNALGGAAAGLLGPWGVSKVLSSPAGQHWISSGVISNRASDATRQTLNAIARSSGAAVSSANNPAPNKKDDYYSLIAGALAGGQQ